MHIKPPPVVELDAVCKRYRDHTALHALNLKLAAGRIYALVGPNGAGKTSLLKLIVGLSKPSSGRILLWGRPVEEHHASGRDLVGFLPELVSFYGTMTGLETLRLFARLKKLPPGQCAALLEQVGLAGTAAKRVKTYSKGMRQRLGLAQALLGRPELLLFGEPTTGLDPDLCRDFYELIDARRANGVTVVVSTHGLSKIQKCADSIIVLKQGHLLATGSMTELCRAAGFVERVLLRVAPGDTGRLLARLEPHHVTREPESGRLEICCRNGGKTALLAELVASGVPLEDIEVHAPQLEEVYHHLMARKVG